MCQISKSKKLRKTWRRIKVYKVLTDYNVYKALIDYNADNNSKKYYSEFYNFEYELGKKYSMSKDEIESSIEPNLYDKTYAVYDGFHSYANKNSIPYLYSYNVIVECIIPRGSFIIRGIEPTILSNCIIIKKVLN